MTLMYKQQTLIVSLNLTKIINLFFKSDWNMSHLVKFGSASKDVREIVDLHKRLE